MKRGIGELLVDDGQISPAELEQAQREKNKTGEPISRVLVRLGLADENQIKNALELEYGVNYVALKKLAADPNTVLLVPEGLVREYEAIPVSREGSRLTLAMVTPSNQAALNVFRGRLPDWQIKPVVCSEDDFLDFANRAYALPESSQSKTNAYFQAEVGSSIEALSYASGNQDDKQHLPAEEDMAIILLSNHIVANALAKGCSNIHIEPTERQVLVHYRKDGVLFSARRLPLAILPALVKRYKKLAALSASEETLPQDGHLQMHVEEQEHSFRLSIVASKHGEHLIIWLT